MQSKIFVWTLIILGSLIGSGLIGREYTDFTYNPSGFFGGMFDSAMYIPRIFLKDRPFYGQSLSNKPYMAGYSIGFALLFALITSMGWDIYQYAKRPKT